MDWDKFAEIAQKFERKAKYQDREDLRQDIIVRLAEVERNNGHKPFTEGAMVRVASYVVMEYWHNIKRKPTTLSLNHKLEDGNGHATEVWESLADDKAIDLEAWMDAKTWLLGCPKRLVEIARKRASGNVLDETERRYFNRCRNREMKKHQEVLF